MTPPIDIRPDHLETVRTILREHLPHGVEVWVFGSRADWTTKDSSDLDLALEGDGPLDPGIVMALELAFQESLLPFSVDVVDLRRVDEGFRRIVLRNRAVLLSDSGVGPAGAPDEFKEHRREWTDAHWGDVAALEYGRALRGYRESRGPCRVYGTNGPIGWHSEPLCRHPTVIVGRKGAYRGVHYAPDPAYVIDTAFYLKPKRPMDVRWAYYALLTNDINGLDAGSAIPSTRREDFYSLPVRLPSPSEQNAIAGVLGALDDRIDLNRRMNETLEAMARALFKSWFVDFDPVQAKMEGRDPGLPQEIADLFPDRLVPSELGEIPEAWEVRTLGSCFELTMGQSPPGYTYNDAGIGLPFFQGRKDFGFRFPRRRQYCSKPMRIARPDDTLVSVRAPVGDINMASERCCVGRGLAALRHRSGSPSFTYYSALAMQLALQTFEGTGTVFGAITKEQFNRKLVLEPGADLVTAFDALAGPTDDQIRTIASSLEGLIQVRDTLLPKLVSGEIRLPPALVERYGANSATAAT